MALKIEHECDWCQCREQVSLRSGMDLTKLPLPVEWESKSAFPGGRVGEQDGQDLCTVCAADFSGVLDAAEKARDEVYQKAIQRAMSRTRAGGQASVGGPVMSSSFNR